MFDVYIKKSVDLIERNCCVVVFFYVCEVGKVRLLNRFFVIARGGVDVEIVYFCYCFELF